MNVGKKSNLSIKMVGDGDNKMRPRIGSRSQPLGTLSYTVNNRDTLTSLAIKFETTPCELRSINKMMSQMIFPGQEIFIPDPDYVTPPITPITPVSPMKSKSISFEHPPDIVPSLSEMTVGSPEKCALKPPGHAERLLKALTPDLERRSSKRKKKLAAEAEAVAADEDDDPSLDSDCLEKFIKVKVKHITDGQGVVNGVLLVTPNAIMFDPDVSDKLILEKGADIYGMVAPMDTIISAAMYHDIAAMTIKGQEHNKVEHDDVEHALTCPSEGVYHSKGCSKRASIIEKLNEKDRDLTECSCENLIDNKLTNASGANLIDLSTSGYASTTLSPISLKVECFALFDEQTSIPIAGDDSLSSSIEIITPPIPEEKVQDIILVNKTRYNQEAVLMDAARDNLDKEQHVGDSFADQMSEHVLKYAEKRRASSSSQAGSSRHRIKSGNHPKVDSEGHPVVLQLLDDGGASYESTTELIEDHFTELGERKRASTISEGGGKEQSIFKRTLKSLPSLGGSFASPNLGSLISPLSGGFFTSSDEEPNSPGLLSQHSSSSGKKSPLSRSRAGSQKRVSPSRMLNSVTGTIREAGIDVWNAVSPSDKLDLFRSIEVEKSSTSNKIVPKPTPLFMNPPLYLCLKIGQPSDTVKVSKTCPIAAYKTKKQGEYWFSIPREKVDKLYAFFVHWSPNIYDCDDSEAMKRGFVVLSETELQQDGNISLAGEAEEDVFDEDNLKLLHKNKLSRQMTKDWEILNVNEMKRRLSEMEEQTIALPELSEHSFILFEKHFRKLMMSLPPRVVDCSWTLIYCTERDGFSLKTVFRKTKNMTGGSILVIQDTSDNLFGAFLTCGIKMSDYFYGTGESYLFSFYPEFKKYAWTNNNDFFIKGNVDSLVFGAGEGSYGLWLDGDLYHGRTQYCETFQNQVLSEFEDFTIKALEIYSLD